MKKLNMAIVGATGLVGRTFLQVLTERNFPIDNLYLFASVRSAGKKIEFRGREYLVEELTPASFDRKVDIALFSAGAEVSLQYGSIARDKGVVVIDNSSAWRMEPTVPLVVPEVNPEDIHQHRGIIANPNCSTIQAVVPLKNLHTALQLKRIIYCTYQSVSGSGLRGIQDLEAGISGQNPQTYPYPIAFNCLPQIGMFMEDGYTKEEIKMVEETRKILHADDLKITATAVRIPVRYSHSIVVNLEFAKAFELRDVYRLLRETDGLIVQDDVKNNLYPLPILAEGTDQVYVGRIRRDHSVENGINMWVVADNIRKGAATNTVQIAELLVSEGLI